MDRPGRLIILGIAIGVGLGCIAGILSYFGLLQYWEKIDYFPYPVEKIIYINVWGSTIWVETKDDGMFTLNHPCIKDPCWKKSETAPDYSDRSGFGGFFDMQVSENCTFKEFTYPLFFKPKTCVGTNIPFADFIYHKYLALTNDGEIWVWNSGGRTVLTFFLVPPLFAAIGLFPGLILGLTLFGIHKLKNKSRKQAPGMPSPGSDNRS